MSRRGHRGASREQRIDAARRVLSKRASIDEICAELDVLPATVKSWVAGLENTERSETLAEFRYAMNVLYWLDRSVFDSVTKDVEVLLAPWIAAARADDAHRKAEYNRAIEERYRELHGLDPLPCESDEGAN